MIIGANERLMEEIIAGEVVVNVRETPGESRRMSGSLLLGLMVITIAIHSDRWLLLLGR